jgi:hypothetical protein
MDASQMSREDRLRMADLLYTSGTLPGTERSKVGGSAWFLSYRKARRLKYAAE